MIPEDRDTTMKDCCMGVSCAVNRITRDLKAYDEQEDEVTSHQTQLQTCILGNAFKPRKEPQDNGKEHHKDCEEDWWEDTLKFRKDMSIYSTRSGNSKDEFVQNRTLFPIPSSLVKERKEG